MKYCGHQALISWNHYDRNPAATTNLRQTPHKNLLLSPLFFCHDCVCLFLYRNICFKTFFFILSLINLQKIFESEKSLSSDKPSIKIHFLFAPIILLPHHSFLLINQLRKPIPPHLQPLDLFQRYLFPI